MVRFNSMLDNFQQIERAHEVTDDVSNGTKLLDTETLELELELELELDEEVLVVVSPKIPNGLLFKTVTIPFNSWYDRDRNRVLTTGYYQ